MIVARNVGADSALYRDVYPEQSGWLRHEMMIADLFDELERVRYSVDCKFAKSRPSKPQRYPRPWEQARRYGSGAIPIDEFWKWWRAG